MERNDKKLAELLLRLDRMMKQQEAFSEEIRRMRTQIYEIQYAENSSDENVNETASKSQDVVSETIKSTTESPKQKELVSELVPIEVDFTSKRLTIQKEVKQKRKPSINIQSDLEKFIGENLISKIGILITIIGVGIGAKYSIEKDLISPLTRIILGYLWGLGLLGAGMKLKTKYINFSAVLVSGAMAIMYFMSYAAYSFYELIPQSMAFVLMLIFTAFTVATALHYNRQIIALIGLVGAYGLPFLLSSNSGNIGFLLTYMTVVNIGILFISFKKSWKTIYYIAFGLSWLIYIIWYLLDYERELHFSIAMIFLVLFFLVFNVIILAYKLLKTDKLSVGDIILLLLNGFIFYGIGYDLLDFSTETDWLLGMFTIGNAAVHLVFARVVYNKKLADPTLFYLMMGVVITFLTIAFPVQLDGNWVTLMWAIEAGVLFWIGRTKKISIYEMMALPLILLATVSQLQDWSEYRYSNDEYQFFDVRLMSGLLYVAVFAFINKIHFNKNYNTQLKSFEIGQILTYVLPGIFIGALYIVFRLEIILYADSLFKASMQEVEISITRYNNKIFDINIYLFKKVWLLLYSLFFVSVLALVNIKKIKNKNFTWVSIVLNLLTLVLFMISGLYTLGLLRDNYLDDTIQKDYYDISFWNILIRYVAYVFAGFLLWTSYLYSRQNFIKFSLKKPFEYVMYISILWITSSELIHCLDMMGSKGTYKIGLSIYWGVYSLYMISRGIQKRKKYIRLMGIAIFAVTLLKLFFYDIQHMESIGKTIVFVILGLLLLIVSFLYNKFKDKIADEEAEV